MKKILLLIILVSTIALNSCTEEDSAGVSRVTTYATMTLKGAENLFWPINTAFVDPGCVAMQGTTDISSKIAATSNVDAKTGGKYTINYKVANSDGFYATTSRTVYVYDPNSTLNGYYTSNISRTTTTTGVVGPRGPYTILVYGVGGSNFAVEDLMGGWYYYGSAYGITYASLGILKLNSDNTLSIVKSYSTAFSSASACVFYDAGSNYDPATKTLVLHTSMGDTPKYQFNVTMNNPTPLN